MRNEICLSINDKDKRFACFYGMLLFSRLVTEEHISFQTESSAASELFAKLMNFVSGNTTDYSYQENYRKNGTTLYSYDILGNDAVRLMKKYRINASGRRINSELILNNSLGVFVAGVFLACGSVNDPSKEYHLEFSVPDKDLAGDLMLMLGGIGINVKSVVRRGQHIVYIKGSESIEDTLTFIGAQQCTLELMNVKIFKDVRNKANRLANCDAANIDKVINAAMKQVEDIILIDKEIGLSELSDELREVAYLRLENSDMSLKEIGEMLSEPISRSGVNHRFKKLAKIAEEIRNGRLSKK